MPVYNALTIPTSIAPGDSKQVWAAEQPTPGSGTTAASQQVAVTRGAGLTDGIIAQGFFSGAPGAFEIDVQGAEVDADAQYQTLPNGNITSVDATNNTWRFTSLDAPAFVRVLMRSRTNAVNVTANIAAF